MDIFMKTQYFNNESFVKDDSTGYYLSSKQIINGRQERMHRYVWRYYYGEIPDGYHIHHIDHNKANNDICNLQLIDSKVHVSLHTKEYHQNNKEKVLKNLNNIRNMTKEWHASATGIEWHKNHYQKMKDKLHVTILMQCLNCNIEFKGLINRSKVCSNKCKSALRRKLKLDNIIKNCIGCNNEFTTNKYSKSIYCSKSCACKMYWHKKNNTIEQ
jgi:hypothetical protein